MVRFCRIERARAFRSLRIPCPTPSCEKLHSTAHRGDFGRLGHGTPEDLFIPRSIDTLRGLKVVSVACGDTHTLAVTQSGDLYSFGRNQVLQTLCFALFHLWMSRFQNPPEARCLRLLQNGQLGHGTTQDSLVPLKVVAIEVCVARALCCAKDKLLSGFECFVAFVALQGTKIKQAACGAEHSVALTQDGRV